MTTDTITIPRDVFDAYQKAVALAREETERVKDERDTVNAWAGQLSLASDLQRADIARLRAQLRQAADALRLAEADVGWWHATVANYVTSANATDRELLRATMAEALKTMHPGAQLLTDLEAAYHALMSYACGNSAPELAEEIAAIIGRRIGKARGE